MSVTSSPNLSQQSQVSVIKHTARKSTTRPQKRIPLKTVSNFMLTTKRSPKPDLNSYSCAEPEPEQNNQRGNSIHKTNQIRIKLTQKRIKIAESFNSPTPSTSTSITRNTNSFHRPKPDTSNQGLDSNALSSYSPIPSTSTGITRNSPIADFSSRRINDYPCGVGKGKGGIKRLKQVMRKQKQSVDAQLNEALDRAQREAQVTEQRGLNNIRQSQYYLMKHRSLTINRFLKIAKDIIRSLYDRKIILDNRMRFQVRAIELLRDVSEDYLIDKFERCALLAAHANRVTCMTKDLALVMRMYRMERR